MSKQEHESSDTDDRPLVTRRGLVGTAVAGLAGVGVGLTADRSAAAPSGSGQLGESSDPIATIYANDVGTSSTPVDRVFVQDRLRLPTYSSAPSDAPVGSIRYRTDKD